MCKLSMEEMGEEYIDLEALHEQQLDLQHMEELVTKMLTRLKDQIDEDEKVAVLHLTGINYDR